MRLGISGFFWDQPYTGSGQYLRHLTQELALESQEELLVFTPGPPVRPAPSGVRLAPLSSPWRGNLGKLWFEQVALPRACRAHRVDLLHVPYFGPPYFAPCLVVVTVHDLIMMAVPQHQGSPQVRAYTALAAAATRRARLILADSEWTKRDILRLLKVSQARVRVAPLAAAPEFAPQADPVRGEVVRSKYGLGPDFILYMGGMDFRKNLTTLIRAFAKVEGPWELAIAGEATGSNSKLYPDLRRVAQEAAGPQERVRFLGWVAEDDRPALYATARLFVFPSLYEGFGLTPLEAMACGTPVLCSSAASLPEVVGEGGLLFDPRDEDGLAQLLAQVLADQGLQEDLRRRGLAQAGRFSWSRTAALTRSAYQEALSLV